MNEPQWKQWNRIIDKLASPSAPICSKVLSDERWAIVAEKVQAGRLRPSMEHEFLTSTTEWAMELLTKKIKERGVARRRGWQGWVKERTK